VAEAPEPVTLRPIGVVHSPYDSLEGMPVQPSRAPDVEGSVEVFEEYVAGLADLDGFSHVVLVAYLHRARPYRLAVVPFLDTEPRGLFATRAPSRPNPIGLSVVELIAVDGGRLTVRGVDLLDGTPLLDLKPYVGEFDGRPSARFGWLEAARARQAKSDGRFG
jgi:tRNA-Thr(GGU) m(6)t(6)A37 methyltransferase TsaA